MTDSIVGGKTHGIETHIMAAGHDLRPYMRSSTASGERNVIDRSTLVNRWRRFRGGKVNGELSAEGLYHSGEGEFDEIARDIHGELVTAMQMPFGQVIDKPFCGVHGHSIAREISSDSGEMLTAMMNILSSTGVDVGLILASADDSVTEDAQTAPVDMLEETEIGGAAYLQVPTYTGTAEKLEVSIEHSATSDGVYTELVSFDIGNVKANGSQHIRIPKGTTMNRWVRVDFDTDTGFTSANVLVGLAKYMP
jgi:hypothetical protein